MFHWLHRIAVALLIGLILLGGWFLYQRRSVFAPAADFVEALKLWEISSARGRESIAGRVTRVRENYTLSIKDDHGTTFNFRLTGLEAPSARNPSVHSASDITDSARESLSDLILSNRVSVAVTYLDANQSGLGIVYLGETNVNALMVETGFAQLKREYLRSLKLGELYALMRADRMARQAE